MRYATSAVIAAWTAGMAVVFGWGLYILGWTLKVTVIDGKPILGFFAYPPEKVYSRHDPVVTDGAEGVSPR